MATKRVTKTAAAKTAEEAELAGKYQFMTDKEHVKNLPDTYIGSKDTDSTTMWVMSSTGTMEYRTFDYNPGLFKLYDEILVNCRDHVVRMFADTRPGKKLVTYIRVTFDPITHMITMENDGDGLDVAMHPTANMWIPQLIFTELRASTNYDTASNNDTDRITGGKNGFGAKLVFLWSTYGRLETLDHRRGLLFSQEYRDNLQIIEPAVVTKVIGKQTPYTRLSFIPDFARFGISPPGYTNDVLSLFYRRVYDIAGVTEQMAAASEPNKRATTKRISVFLNDQEIAVDNFKKYVDLYPIDGMIYERANERWEYAIAISPMNQFTHMSFVNGIATTKGGTHVDYIVDQIVGGVAKHIEDKKKTTVSKAFIKQQLMLFLRCDINRPAFDSQTKEFMTTKRTNFGSTCQVSEDFIKKVIKLGVCDRAIEMNEIRDLNKTIKDVSTKSRKNFVNVPKLEDANFAGTAKSNKCILFLVEGDSAKTAAMSGMNSADRDYLGLLPLRGKLKNIRGEKPSVIFKKNDENAKTKRETNEELRSIIKTLGLELGREYTSLDDIHQRLRYGKVVILTDQDLDGLHINGLLINFIHYLWPSLIRIEGFIQRMNTPIMIANKGSQRLKFYSQPEFKLWQQSNPTGWSVKYYKGLGTSTKQEFTEYMNDRENISLSFVYTTDTDNAIDLLFNDKRANERKPLIVNHDASTCVDVSHRRVPYDEFIYKELVHFSHYDCMRSIPSLIDGFKPSLRKIMFSVIKRNLIQELKVAQLAGYVSEHSAYHHGEASLLAAIIGMAQNFVGSNNINLLEPCGQFGTRLSGGKDHASPRYIFTKMSNIARKIFRPEDDPILNYLIDEDDGVTKIEPQFYVPIIPMILVNGTEGIGTGFSTSIPQYNPTTIIQYLRARLTGENQHLPEFIPYYEGFQGTITPNLESINKFTIKGNYQLLNPTTIAITELPIGYWTDNFADDMKNFEEKGLITGQKKNYTDVTIYCEIEIPNALQLSELRIDEDIDGIEQMFKLTTTVNTTNMHLYDSNGHLIKFERPEDIIESYIPVRLQYYSIRKQYLLNQLRNNILKAENKARFINEIIASTIDLRNYTDETATTHILSQKRYALIDNSYDYLTDMKLNTLTKKRVAELQQNLTRLQQEYIRIESTSEINMWLNELSELESEYITYKQERAAISIPITSATTTSKRKRKQTR